MPLLSGRLNWVVLALGITLPAYPQSNLATVTGIVTDAADAVVPGANVTIRNVETGITRELQSNEEGSYTITNLSPGSYAITAKAEGFRTYQLNGVVLQVGQVMRTDIRMEVGAVTESVTVSGTVAALNTESGTVKGDVIIHQEIQELPLDGRDFVDLAFFVPGVVPKAQGGQGSALNVNGARASNTNFYVDGFNNRNARGAAAQVRPNIDAMQEFKMEVSGYSAEYGRFAGGILNMVLRSGANDFHGSVFYYLRNDIFDARGFFEEDKNKLRRNQFGATVSGPIFRNRTFFLFSYEGYTQELGQTRLGHVPTPEERSGDFSRSIDYLGRSISLKDPLVSGTCSATNRTACFPNNIIPASRIDPIALNILKYYPLPNRADIRNNYLVTANDSDKWNSLLTKIDHRFNAKDSISFRYQMRFNRTQGPFNGSDLGTFGNWVVDNRSLAGLDWTHIFSPSLLIEFRGGYSRNAERDRGNFQGTDMSAELGLPSLVTEPDLMDFPKITVLDHFEIGTDASQPVQFHVTDLQFSSKLTWVKSRHVIKGGFDVSKVRFNQPYYNNQRGTYNFQGRWTNAPMADMLLGLLHSSTRQLGYNRNYWRVTSYGMFINDDFKASRNLTLNLGLRYEVNKPPTDRYMRMASYYPGLNQVVMASADTVPDLEDLVAAAGMQGRITTAAAAGISPSLIATDYTNVSPRIGLAWRPFGSEKTVIRTGYGIFYAGELLNPLRDQLANNFPFAVRQTFNRVTSNPAAVTLQNPFPEDRATLTGVNNGFGVDADPPTGYLQAYNFTVERVLFREAVLETGFVGSKGTHLARRYDINQPLRTREIWLSGAGFARPYTGFNNIQYVTFGANSIHNALHVSFRKRGGGNLFYRLNYAYSKSIDDASQMQGNSDGGFPGALDPRNLKLDRGRSDFDFGHVVSGVFSWQVPVGRGRRYFSDWRGVKQAVGGGWQLSGTARLSTGAPYTVRTSDVDLNLGESDRPNRIAKGTYGSDAPVGRRGPDYPWFNVRHFEEVPCGDPTAGASCNASMYGFDPFQFGNSGRNILDGPGLITVDLGIRKNLRMAERRSLQVRLDCFNVLNRTNFRLPNNFFNQVTGGLITQVGASGREGGPRVFQAALSFQF
jgi:hypothetical protein